MLPIASLLLLPAALQAPAPLPPLVDAKTLPGVPGPLVPHYPDPAFGPGTSGMDLVIRERARRGINIPAAALPAGSCRVSDQVAGISGWKAYRVDVPGGGGFKVRLHSPQEAWFLVKVVDAWGREGAGMLQNRIPTGNPEASYRNPKASQSTVFIIVDTKDTSLQGTAYTLTLTRD